MGSTRFSTLTRGEILKRNLPLDEQLRRYIKSSAKPAYVLSRKLPLTVEYLGDDAGCAEDIQQIFLFQVVRLHEFAQNLNRAGRLERVVLFFKVLDQQRQEIRYPPLGSRHPIALSVQFFQHGDVALVLRLIADHRRQSAG